MNPGDVRFIGAKLASSPMSTSVIIRPPTALDGLGPGTLLRFAWTLAEVQAMVRPGWGTIRTLDKTTGEVTFDLPLATLVPAVAEGDSVFEYEPPCSRCECKRCQADRAGQTGGDTKP